MSAYPDSAFISAVENTVPQRGQIDEIAKHVGCSKTTVTKRLRKLQESGQVLITARKTYDQQTFRPGNASQRFFGGAGSCVRRYLTVELTKKTEV